MTKHLTVGLALVFIAACSRESAIRVAAEPTEALSLTSPTAAAPVPKSTATHSAAELPLRVRWGEASRTGDALRLTAEIEYRAPFALPLNLELQLPPGVELAEGSLKQALPPAERPGTARLAYAFKVEGTPEEDLVLAADVQTESFGFHATDRYRFGRPAPQVKPLERKGPELKFGPYNFGPSVLIEPK